MSGRDRTELNAFKMERCVTTIADNTGRFFSGEGSFTGSAWGSFQKHLPWSLESGQRSWRVFGGKTVESGSKRVAVNVAFAPIGLESFKSQF